MANSKTLLVYVLALVVCGGSSSFWVSANTVPLLKEPVAVAGASPQHQKHQQQIPSAKHQQIQETSRTPPSSPSPSSATPVVAVAPPQHQSYGATNNNNNAQPTYSIKNAWGLSAGSSDSGPYTAGYGYISGRTLQQPVTSHKSEYELARPIQRPIASRQMSTIFDGFAPAAQAFFGSGLDIKSILLGGIMSYGVQNFGLPETFNSLIPMRRLFQSWTSKATDVKKEEETLTKKEEPVPVKDVSETKVSETVKEVPNKKGIKETSPIEQTNEIPVENIPNNSEEPAKDAPAKKGAPEKDSSSEKEVPAKDAPSVKESPVEDGKKEAEPTNRRRKRDISPQPDTDLTELAAMVLSAIQSGECMQRSICILGSQIGASNKGRVAFTLVDKLVPESVQGNQYFVTLKKALRGGETFCDRFRCRLN